MGTVTFYHTFFLEDDVEDGDFPRDDVDTEVFDGIGAVEAARLIEREGLSFAATGNEWAADPDGSRIVDYSTGRRVETSAHLSYFHPRVVAAIIERVG